MSCAQRDCPEFSLRDHGGDDSAFCPECDQVWEATRPEFCRGCQALGSMLDSPINRDIYVEPLLAVRSRGLCMCWACLDCWEAVAELNAKFCPFCGASVAEFLAVLDRLSSASSDSTPEQSEPGTPEQSEPVPFKFDFGGAK